MATNYNKLVGYKLPHKLGEIFVEHEVKKDRWNSDWSLNKAISKVYGGTFFIKNYADVKWNGIQHMKLPFVKSTIQYKKFKNLFLQKFTPNQCTDFGGCFDEVVKYGYEIDKVGHPAITVVVCEEILNCDFGDYQLAFCPYNDGVMLIDITIDKDKRNKGFGTEIMNMIYDISEDNNIPLYLIPYPAEQFKSKKEKSLVDKLQKWYSKIGFGPLNNTSHIWCNME
jgi:hypothetical protein